MPAKKADSFESELWTDDSTFSHGEQRVSRPNVHGVCEANGSEFSEKKQVPYVRRSGFPVLSWSWFNAWWNEFLGLFAGKRWRMRRRPC